VDGFSVGYFSHLVADAVGPILRGEVAELGYLLWPVTPIAADAGGSSIIGYFLNITLTPYFLFQILVLFLGASLWVADGVPGWGAVRRTSRAMLSNRALS
jgi:hypothetical protein